MAAATRSTATTWAAVRMLTPSVWARAHTSVNAVSMRCAQPLGHHLVVPRVALLGLGPLEVAGRHAPGVGQDVGHDHDAPPVEHGLGLDRRRPVRRLDDELAP